MNQTTKETRRRSYDAVLPKRAARCRLILETLGNRELTASEITEELVAAGRIPYFNRNYVAPRLTELKEIGILHHPRHHRDRARGHTGQRADEGRPPVMTTEERRALLDRAITAYGAPAQMDMAVEEMAELTKALCKIKRAQAGCEVTAAIGNVIEEMADVQIMLDQLRIIFHRSTEEVEEAKLERLKNRLDGRNNWQGSSLHKWIEKQFSTGGDGHE